MPRILPISDVNGHGGYLEGARALPSKAQTSLSHLKIYNGPFSGESIWKIFLRSFPFVLSPVVGHVLFGVKYSLDNGALMYLIDVVRVPRILHANNTAQYVPRFLSPVFVAWPQANN